MTSINSFLTRNRDPYTKQQVGIGGFTALVRVREGRKLTADAPDTPVEDGSFVNDHIILKPLTLSIEGSVSDVYVEREPAQRRAIRELAVLGNFTSQYGLERTQAQLSRVAAIRNDLNDAVDRVESLVDAGNQVIDLFGNRDDGSKPLQELFLDAMESLYYGKQAFTIDMPYRRHDRMVMTSFDTEYNNQENTTRFTIEAKQIKIANLEYAKIQQASGGTGGQLEDQSDKGPQEGEPEERSLLFSLIGKD